MDLIKHSTFGFALALTFLFISGPALGQSVQSQNSFTVPDSPQTVSAAVSEIARKLQNGNSGEALEFAEDQAAFFAGEPEFDYLLGLSALAEQEYNTAAFAFERILILQPDHHRARLELARSQYHLGDYSAARSHFQRVLASNPPDGVSERVNGYLDVIQFAESTNRHQGGLTLNLGAGYDDNVNSATDLPTLDLFGLRFLIPESNLQTEDGFVRAGAAGNYRYRLTQNSELFTDLSVERKDNFEEDAFDLSETHLRAGYRTNLTGHSLTFALNHRHYWLEDKQLLYMSGAEAVWQLTSGDWKPYSFLSASAVRYPGNSFQNRNQYLLGLGNQVNWQNVSLNVSAYGAHEPATDSAAKVIGRDQAGVNSSLKWNATSANQFGLSANYLHTRFHDRNALFNETRQDDKLGADIFWRFVATRNLHIETRVSYQDSRSSLDIFSYDQLLGEIGISYRIF